MRLLTSKMLKLKHGEIITIKQGGIQDVENLHIIKDTGQIIMQNG